MKLLIFAIMLWIREGPQMNRTYGIVIFQKICHLFAPSILALSNWSVGMFIRIPVAESI